GAKRMRGTRLLVHTNIVENQARNGPLRMKLGRVDQAWRALRGSLPWPLGRISFDGAGFATFQTYRKFSSVAVATRRLDFRVARFSAERTFSLVSPSSAKGTLKAAPSPRLSRSRRIAVTIFLCFPFRERGTSTTAIVLKRGNARFVFMGVLVLLTYNYAHVT